MLFNNVLAKVTKEFAKFSLGEELRDDLVYVWCDQFTAIAREIVLLDCKRVSRTDPSDVFKLQLRHGFAQAFKFKNNIGGSVLPF